MKRMTLAFVVSAVSASSVFAMAEISNVVVEPGSGSRVRVSYSISEDAVVTPRFYAGGRWLEGHEVVLLSGDVCCRVSATTGAERRTFVWRAKDEADIALDKATTYDDAKVELTAWALTAPPDYMVVDLQSNNRDVVRYYATSNDVPGGILADDYKLRKIALRKIPARSVTWMMGSSSATDGNDSMADETRHAVTFSDDYYIGVYPLTQSQSQLAFGSAVRNPNKFGGGDDAPYRPTCGYGWNYYRGSTATPTDAPASGSWFANLKDATGVDFDVPTEAQWEFACRAGTQTPWYCGKSTDASANCWYNGNSATGYTEQLTHPVGHFPPNNFGLYDMMGNVFELCRDSYGEHPETGVTLNPLQSIANANFVYRGGCYVSVITQTRSAFRTSLGPSTDSYGAGVRLSCPAVAK